MSRAHIVFPCLLLVLTACATSPTAPQAGDGKQAAATAIFKPDNVPAEFHVFAYQVREAFLAKDLDRFMSYFHPDFRTDGKNLAQQREYLRTEVFPFVSEWEYRIDEARIDGQRAFVKAHFVTEYGKLPGDSEMVLENGRWLWFGNRK